MFVLIANGSEVHLADYFFFLSSSNRLDKSSKSISSSSLLPPADVVGTSGKSDGTFGKLAKSSTDGGGAVGPPAGGDIFARGIGFGVLFKFYMKT